nr:hypothetical protein [Tanacetum cinerariifolium]
MGLPSWMVVGRGIHGIAKLDGGGERYKKPKGVGWWWQEGVRSGGEELQSSDCKTKSSSTSLNSLLEESNTFDNSLPEFKTFCFDVEEISSGSTTTPPDISLSEYEAFHDHVKEISSGSPTTHSDSSLYASFVFDLSINPFPPTDRSDSYEFTDELIPFISAPQYDCFLFKVEPNSRDFTKDVVEDISPTKEP